MVKCRVGKMFEVNRGRVFTFARPSRHLALYTHLGVNALDRLLRMRNLEEIDVHQRRAVPVDL